MFKALSFMCFFFGMFLVGMGFADMAPQMPVSAFSIQMFVCALAAFTLSWMSGLLHYVINHKHF